MLLLLHPKDIQHRRYHASQAHHYPHYTGLVLMATSLSAKRLRKELVALQRDPVENITARPLERLVACCVFVSASGGLHACIDVLCRRARMWIMVDIWT